MNNLPNEIIVEICKYLKDYDCLIFLSCSKNLNRLINEIIFTSKVKLTESIISRDYYDNFTYIHMNFLPKKYPKNIRKLHFMNSFNQDVHGAIPEGITHLIFGWNFNKNIRGAIPNGITHLTFGHNFNQDISGAIPNSVTHLTFGNNFNRNITGAIPNNVTHLTFGNHFNQDIYGEIPDSVTHLTLRNINQDIGNAIPPSVIHLTISIKYRYKDTLSKTINKITYKN